MAFYEISGAIERASNERAAVTSAKKLAREIDDVCSSIDSGYSKEVELSLPQNGVIYPKLLKPILKTTLATFQISRSGDPDFIIYYNDFPQLEDLTWFMDVRNEISPYELITYPSDGTTDGIKKNNILNNFVKEKTGIEPVEIFSDLYMNNTKPRYVLISNILPYNSTEGKWDEKYPYVYLYNMSSYDLNVKLMRKYQICGKNAICLKTDKMLYRFPLKCNVSYIELEKGIKPEDKTWFKNMMKKIFGLGTRSFTIGDTSSSFYMASPCRIKVKIKKGECEFHRNETYPIYEYDKKNDKLIEIGNRTIYQKGWENELVNKSMMSPDNENKVDCIQIIPISSPYGFCYSSPNMNAALFVSFTHINISTNPIQIISRDMWIIGEKHLNVISERSEMENYILKRGIGRIKKFFFTWPDHPLN